MYTITFNSNGGTTITDLTEQTTLPTPLPTPTKSGYTFVAWYYDSAFTQKANAGDTIESNVTLYAKWHNLGSLFTEIADAIRSKDGTSENIRDVDFGERVKQIQGAKEEETKTVTPNFSSGNEVVTPTSGKVLSQVTINKDGNLISDNIKSGVTIFGITGTYEGEPSGFTLAIVCNCRGYYFSYPLYYSIDDGTNWVYIANTAASYAGTVNLSNITQIKFKLYIDYGYEDGCWLKVGTTVGGSDLYNGTGQYTLSELISPNIPITSNTTLYVSSFGAD